MPSYQHIEQYRTKLQELIEFGGSDNEENIRPAFQNCLDAYCHDHRERLVLIPELKNSPSNKPDGTVKDSLRMARGYWEAKDSHDDLDAEIKVKFNRGYPRDNIIFEDSQTAVLNQSHGEMRRYWRSNSGAGSSPSTDERGSLAQQSQSSSPLECTSHLGFSLVHRNDIKLSCPALCKSRS